MEQGIAPGALVRVRGREWVVLPISAPDLLRLRPITGAGQGETSIYLPLEGEGVASARFAPPEPRTPSDLSGASVLFNAARLSLRSGAAPFRSLGHISVTPRPYQFVPLIMALKLAPVRLLIADDVGVGKTIEAGLIARELLDRGIARRLGVLCPAHLCDQWEQELREKFGIEAALIDSANFARLERARPRQDISVYKHYPHFVASIDLVKSDRHREHFLRDAPDLILVDEAHGASRPRGAREKNQQHRYELLRDLADDKARHLVLTTATPHSGIEESFRSLLGLLHPQFDINPDNSVPELNREALVPHFVQRRRKDVEKWMGAGTRFPDRITEERKYELSTDYYALVQDVIDYCADSMEAGKHLGAIKQRVRLWGAISVLRSVLSSPAAAQAVLGTRRAKAVEAMEEQTQEGSIEQVDHLYRPETADSLDDEALGDFAPTGALENPLAGWTAAEQKKLRSFEKRAAALETIEKDNKARVAVEVVRKLLKDGFHPIIFCRFIPTAAYVEGVLARELSGEFKEFLAKSVTGNDGDEVRRERIQELVEEAGKKNAHRVLVATDCLSEGINLQEHFDAIVHYDLPWNPNRLEQREGRVDRFGQKRLEVRAVTLVGTNNRVDQIVLKVLLEKATAIREQLGISLPVPVGSEEVVRGILSDILFGRKARDETSQIELALDTPATSTLHQAFEKAAKEEKSLRAFFAQRSINPEEVAREMEATDKVLGTSDAVRQFLTDALPRFGGKLAKGERPETWRLTPGHLESRLKEILGERTWPVEVIFDRLEFERANPDDDDEPLFLGRTHPAVVAVCDAALDAALSEDESTDGIMLTRTGAVFADTVKQRTGLALLRVRYRLQEDGREEFAEEIVVAGFTKGAKGPAWLLPLDQALPLLLEAKPTANMSDKERREHAEWALELLADEPAFGALLEERKRALTESHRRIRKLLKEPKLTVKAYRPDILGCFVLVPGSVS